MNKRNYKTVYRFYLLASHFTVPNIQNSHSNADFKRFKEGNAERNLFLEQNQNIFIFSAETDVCSSSCKIVFAPKRPLIYWSGRSLRCSSIGLRNAT